MSGWSCPHQTGDYQCKRVKTTCHPGMKGCILRGKVVFAYCESVLLEKSKPLKISSRPIKHGKAVPVASPRKNQKATGVKARHRTRKD